MILTLAASASLFAAPGEGGVCIAPWRHGPHLRLRKEMVISRSLNLEG
jgi:hypothetical protein